jgi:hypothetical protein
MALVRRELFRLYELHKLYFFTTDSRDLLPITPALQRELEAILLREPRNQNRPRATSFGRKGPS